jgi:hypothetical protein
MNSTLKMEEIQLHYDLNKNKCYHLKDIIFECFGNNPSSGCQFSGTTTKLAIVYDIVYIKCYINSVHYGPGTCYSQDNGWCLYKQYRLVSFPDIPFIVSEMKKYERIMMLGKCGFQLSDTYGVDLIIDILKLIINGNNKGKDHQIEMLKMQLRDKEQLRYLSELESLKLEIKDKYKETEIFETIVISEDDEIHAADVKAKQFALKDKEAKERLRMLYEENISIQMSEFVQEQLNHNQ